MHIPQLLPRGESQKWLVTVMIPRALVKVSRVVNARHHVVGRCALSWIHGSLALVNSCPQIESATITLVIMTIAPSFRHPSNDL